jgi:DNA-binding transcriptional LysR family regulator
MEISQLAMFKVVAEQGSIIRASEILHCVPSNVTNRIKLLEGELGVSLFVRTGRGLVISPAGRLFLGYAQKILSLCEESKRAIDPASGPSGILKIGAIESAATGRLPKVLSQYHQAYPAVKLDFNTGVWSALLNDVVSHRLEGAIIAVRPEHPDIQCSEIYKEELVLIAPQALGTIRRAQDLGNAEIFMWPEGCPYRASLESWLGRHGVTRTLTSIASYGTIMGCVSSGAGVSLVPKGMFEQFKGVGPVAGYVFDDLLPIPNYFISNRHVGLHRAKDKFLELLKEEFKEVC